MNPTSPHLDLAQLLSQANGEPAYGPAREHLAICESCRAEARRWGIVADGVRGLAADAPGAAAVPGLAGMPGRPRRTGLARLADPRRRSVLLASAAAAVIVLGGAGYGLASAFDGHATSPAGGTRTTALAAVNGCASLAQVTGTLEQVNGNSLVVRTSSGQSVAVTATAATRINLSTASPSDITDGSPVRVDGVESNGTIAAQKVAVGEPTSPGSGKTPPPGGALMKKTTEDAVPGGTIVQGTVADATSTGFTVDTSAGTQIPVTTSGITLVVVDNASPSELQIGADTIVIGYAEPGGGMSAVAIAQIIPSAKVMFSINGCSAAAVDNAMTTAFGS